MRPAPCGSGWFILTVAIFAGLSAANSFHPYEAIAYLKPGSPTGDDLTRGLTEAAQKRGYARVDEAGRGYTVQPGFERLMAFKAVECREYAGIKCSEGPSIVKHGLILIDRELRSSAIVIRFIQWCASSCEANSKAMVDLLTEEIENAKP
jgi:hypothetical protein